MNEKECRRTYPEEWARGRVVRGNKKIGTASFQKSGWGLREKKGVRI